MSVEALFSIYKIDIGKFNSIDGFLECETIDRPRRAIDILLQEVSQINRERKAQQNIFKDDEISGVIYKTNNDPAWRCTLMDLFSQKNQKIGFSLVNTNVSYILFYPYKNALYAMTGGYGSYLIKKYIENDWGLSIIPKIIEDTDGAIRLVRESNMYGNTLSVSKANRRTTNVKGEKELNSIFQEMSLEVDKSVADRFGIQWEETNRKLCVSFKDSLNFNKSMTIMSLEKLLRTIYEIEKTEDKYALNYFIKCTKNGISKTELMNELQSILVAGNYENVLIMSEDYAKFYIESYRYVVKDGDAVVCTSIGNPIAIKDIVETAAGGRKITKSLISKVLKFELHTKDSNGNTLIGPSPIFDLLQGFVEYSEKRIPCYLIRGQWYCLNSVYLDYLQGTFRDKYTEQKDVVEEIKKIFGLGRKSGITEDEYNNSFYGRKEVIVAHKAGVSYFEIADLIFWDSEKVYLMCNKAYFGGPGARDLTNQILASTTYLQSQLSSVDKSLFLSEYYQKINNKYQKDGYSLDINEKEFIDLFDKRIVIISGYMKNFTIEAKSNYAKFLYLDSKKRVELMGYDYYAMNIL